MPNWYGKYSPEMEQAMKRADSKLRQLNRELQNVINEFGYGSQVHRTLSKEIDRFTIVGLQGGNAALRADSKLAEPNVTYINHDKIEHNIITRMSRSQAVLQNYYGETEKGKKKAAQYMKELEAAVDHAKQLRTFGKKYTQMVTDSVKEESGVEPSNKREFQKAVREFDAKRRQFQSYVDEKLTKYYNLKLSELAMQEEMYLHLQMAKVVGRQRKDGTYYIPPTDVMTNEELENLRDFLDRDPRLQELFELAQEREQREKTEPPKVHKQVLDEYGNPLF